MEKTEKSIVLIGFMGVGKTTVGELIATKLNRRFIDIDEEIVKSFGMPVTEIFSVYGEKAFREKEKQLIKELIKHNGNILSLGGGAFLQEEIRNACLSDSIVIFLHLSWDCWKDRISLLIDSRPVLQGRTMEEIDELFNNRQTIYKQHHVKINTDHKTPDDTADFIIEWLDVNKDGLRNEFFENKKCNNR